LPHESASDEWLVFDNQAGGGSWSAGTCHNEIHQIVTRSHRCATQSEGAQFEQSLSEAERELKGEPKRLFRVTWAWVLRQDADDELRSFTMKS